MIKQLAIITALLSLAILPALAVSADKAADSKATTLTGCLSGPNPDGAFTLKTGSKLVEVGGTSELNSHVGHEVKLTGNWAKSGSEIGEQEPSGTKGEKHEQHFKVSSIQHVAETCTSKDSKTESKSEKKSGY